MKKRNLILIIFMTTFYNSTFSMRWPKLLFWKSEENHAQPTTNEQRRKTIESINSLRQSSESGDYESIIAYDKFEQAVNNPEKQITELRIKRILDALDLIGNDDKVNNDVRNIYKELNNK